MQNVVSLVCVLIFGCCCSGSAVAETAFYRIVGESDSVIISLDRSGTLTWSNAAVGGNFLVERSWGSNSLSGWQPHMRGGVSNSISSFKVHDFSPPPGMALIPGGQFLMGGEQTGSTPIHSVVLSPFFMLQHEVVNDQVRAVFQWAYDQGLIAVTNDIVYGAVGMTNGLLPLYTGGHEIDFAGGTFTVLSGKENHPCVYISWYGAAAYCNYLSLMEGRTPCYDFSDWTCDFTQNGYRLPTESEWECAARGGHEQMRFPWGDTNVITHSRANYRSLTNVWYDVSPTQGFHPDYANQLLRTSPVGAFAPNNYGLYDMSGNVWEWVYDWALRYPSEPQVDPVGPATGTFKVFRGGSNYTSAERVTCAARYVSTRPEKFGYDTGFRTAISVLP